MQTVLFNTTLKTVKVYSGLERETTITHTFSNVSTVKIREEGFYEVIQKINDYGTLEWETSQSIPVARFPIANSNMIIEK